MQFIHRVSAASSAEVRKELAALGIIVGAADFVSFDFDEAHPAWPQLQRWIAKRRAVDILSTRFSQPEIAAALWLELEPSWHHGFPQPDHDAGFPVLFYFTCV
jgi:hypothetical protein